MKEAAAAAAAAAPAPAPAEAVPEPGLGWHHCRSLSLTSMTASICVASKLAWQWWISTVLMTRFFDLMIL